MVAGTSQSRFAPEAGGDMHEMGITQSIVDAVCDKMPDARVVSVQLEIGTLAGVMPDAVRFCFDLASAGTSIEGARLDIDQPPGRAHCRDCDADVDLPDLILICPCGSANVAVTSGTELRIRAVEVA